MVLGCSWFCDVIEGFGLIGVLLLLLLLLLFLVYLILVIGYYHCFRQILIFFWYLKRWLGAEKKQKERTERVLEKRVD